MKKLIALLLTASLLVFPVMNVFAAEGDQEIPDGYVEWDGSKLNDNLDDLQEKIGDMQPGDSLTYKVTVKNSSPTDTDFWMSNEILQSFEDNGKASDGAYTYYLAYTGPDGTEVFYNNLRVGGDDAQGLHEVPDGVDSKDLAEAIYLGKLAQDQSGEVTLMVALDGETQGNAYQNADGRLRLKFGVEQRDVTNKRVNKTENKTVYQSSDVKTGDDFNMLPLSIAALAAGILLVVVATGRRKKAIGR